MKQKLNLTTRSKPKVSASKVWSPDAVRVIEKRYVPLAQRYGRGVRCRPAAVVRDGELGFVYDADGIGDLADGVSIFHLLQRGKVELRFLEMGNRSLLWRTWFEVCIDKGMRIDFHRKAVAIDVPKVRPESASVIDIQSFKRAVRAAVLLRNWHSTLEIPPVWRTHAEWMFSNDGSKPPLPRIRWSQVFESASRLGRKASVFRDPAKRDQYSRWLRRHDEA